MKDMTKEEIEIPFGKEDSELEEYAWRIPEGYSAVIEGDKVVLRKKEGQESIKAYGTDDLRLLDALIYIFDINYIDCYYKVYMPHLYSISAKEIIERLTELKERLS